MDSIRAHAASYGRVAYQTAYMKSNFPVEYMTAIMTSNQVILKKSQKLFHGMSKKWVLIICAHSNINESFGGFTVIVGF